MRFVKWIELKQYFVHVSQIFVTLSQISFILYLVDYKDLRVNDGYIYPDWAYTVGWIMTFSSAIMVPLWAVGEIGLTAGTFKQVGVHLLQSKYLL